MVAFAGLTSVLQHVWFGFGLGILYQKFRGGGTCTSRRVLVFDDCELQKQHAACISILAVPIHTLTVFTCTVFLPLTSKHTVEKVVVL